MIPTIQYVLGRALSKPSVGRLAVSGHLAVSLSHAFPGERRKGRTSDATRNLRDMTAAKPWGMGRMDLHNPDGPHQQPGGTFLSRLPRVRFPL